MKLVPMLFSTPMVHALLDGRKTQTRRIMSPQPNSKATEVFRSGDNWTLPWGAKLRCPGEPERYEITDMFKCRYGSVTDLIYVRETFNPGHNGYPRQVLYRANERYGVYEGMKWKPGIHMPKKSARIWLRITDIRAERLKCISEADAKAEGLEFNWSEGQQFKDYLSTDADPFQLGYSVDSFESLWTKINGADSWKANPWVWVINFRVESTTGILDVPNYIRQDLSITDKIALLK